MSELIPLIIIFLIVYFLFIKPKEDKIKARLEMSNNEEKEKVLITESPKLDISNNVEIDNALTSKSAKSESSPVAEHISQSWAIYKERPYSLSIFTFLNLSAIGFAIFFVIKAEYIIVYYWGRIFGTSGVGSIILFPFAIPFLLLIFIVPLFSFFFAFGVISIFQLSSIYIIDSKIGMKDALHKALSRFSSFTWVSILQYIYICIGSFFPLLGMVVRVAYLFAPIVVALEGEQGFKALRKSEEYVKKKSTYITKMYFGFPFGFIRLAFNKWLITRLLLLLFISVPLSVLLSLMPYPFKYLTVITYTPSILVLLLITSISILGPVETIYYYLLYKELKSLKK